MKLFLREVIKVPEVFDSFLLACIIAQFWLRAEGTGQLQYTAGLNFVGEVLSKATHTSAVGTANHRNDLPETGIPNCTEIYKLI